MNFYSEKKFRRFYLRYHSIDDCRSTTSRPTRYRSMLTVSGSQKRARERKSGRFARADHQSGTRNNGMHNDEISAPGTCLWLLLSCVFLRCVFFFCLPRRSPPPITKRVDFTTNESGAATPGDRADRYCRMGETCSSLRTCSQIDSRVTNRV